MKSKIIKTIIAILLVTVMASSSTYAANPADFGISPSSSSVANGTSFNVYITENGDNVNVVTTKLSFDSTKLQLSSMSCGSSFPSQASGSGSTISCYTTGSAASGIASAATATFTAIAGSGTTTVSIANGSQIASGGANIWSGSLSSTSVALTTPVTATPTSPSSTQTSTPVASASSKSTSVNNTTSTPGAATTDNTASPSTATPSTSQKGSVLAATTAAKKSSSGIHIDFGGIVRTWLLPFITAVVVAGGFITYNLLASRKAKQVASASATAKKVQTTPKNKITKKHK